MSDIYIGGEKREIHFGEHTTAKDFLTHPENKHVAEDYLEQAKKTGKASFYDKEGNKFNIEHKAEEDGKDSFSIHRHY